MFRCNQNTKRDKNFYTPDLRFLSYDFQTAVSRTQKWQKSDEQGSYRVTFQRMYIPCGDRPKDVQDFARRSHVVSATVLRISRKPLRHPQNCIATIERRAQFPKTAVGTPHMVVRLWIDLNILLLY